MSFYKIEYADSKTLELITISSRQLKVKDKEEQQTYKTAVKTLIESEWKYWSKGSKEQYDWHALRDSILEKWNPFKVGINYRTDCPIIKDPYMVQPWRDTDGSIYYHPLTIHRTFVLMALPEMEIEVLIAPGYKNIT